VSLHRLFKHQSECRFHPVPYALTGFSKGATPKFKRNQRGCSAPMSVPGHSRPGRQTNDALNPAPNAGRKKSSADRSAGSARACCKVLPPRGRKTARPHGCLTRARSAAKTDKSLHRSECPLWAIRDQSARQQNGCYSITSSASAVKLIGTASPRALAVLALMTSSNFTGAWTGSSLGLAPFKMRST
jgi:hypothetical protein